MLNPDKILEKAKTSSFYLQILNWSLSRMIPFNKPHGFRIVTIEDYRLKIKLPYRGRNLNHIKGLHACALATISEFSTGFLLISKLGFSQYRIILQRLEMDYHYQGKMDAYGEFAITEDWLQQQVIIPLKSKESVVVNCEVKIHDTQSNHLTTGHVHWQIKNWEKVKTKT